MKEFTAICSVEKGEKKNSQDNRSIFTVYFASENEKLWDIAKSHDTSEAKIRCFNPDVNDVTDTDCLLVFEQE